MGSTNKTPYLDLSQFVASDKPTFGGDYVSDMSKIDNGVKGLADSVAVISTGLNNLTGGVYTKVEIDAKIAAERVTSDGEYITATDLTPYAKTADVAPLNHTHTTAQISGFQAAVDARVAAGIAAIPPGPTPTSVQSGTYAGRPAAGSVAVNSLYVCTDIPEQYIKVGSAWVPNGSGGNELGNAQITTSVESSTTAGQFTDVPGLTTTFKVGERPIEIGIHGLIGANVLDSSCYIKVFLDSDVVINFFERTKDTTGDTMVSASTRKIGLSPGSTHTVKVQIAYAWPAAQTPGKSRFTATNECPWTLSVVTR